MTFQMQLGAQATAVSQAIVKLTENKIMERIWAHDHTVWRPDPTEIENRLGWLHAPQNMQAEIERLTAFAAEAKADGFTDVLLLGMGGSSLAPEMYNKIYGGNGLDLQIMDSTDPDAVLAHARRLDVTKTLFIVATKSGGTVETLSGFKYFYNLLAATVSEALAGRHFVAITDPGSKLVDLAAKYNFRETFINDPNVGGRYSALTFFGMAPAALIGLDLAKLLGSATAVNNDEAAQVGAVIGAMAQNGRDKLTIIASDPIAPFGDWAEQLIAESTGKEGKGVLPVVGEPVGDPAVYGEDRLFVHLRLAGDDSQDAALAALTAVGHPLIRFELQDAYDLGGQFLLWELATAVAGHLLDIQPFDQPNVESAKIMARKMVAEYMETGQLPASGAVPANRATLHAFLAQSKAHDYISIQAYTAATPETDAALAALQAQLRDRYKAAVTVGYGPRFLHSTGQLHKGDAGNGLFVQIISAPAQDVAIPDEAGAFASGMSFGTLKASQAMGDAAALTAVDRRLLQFDVGTAVVDGLKKLLD